MSEDVYFADSAVRVTSSEVSFGSIWYGISDVNSARSEIVFPPHDWAYWLYWVLLVAALGMTITRWVVNPDMQSVLYAFLDWGRDVALLAVLLLSIWSSSRVRYVVKLRGDFGEKDVVIARRWKYARDIARAVNNAVKLNASQTLSAKV